MELRGNTNQARVEERKEYRYRSRSRKEGIRGKKICDGVNGRELLEVAMEKIEGLRRLETEKKSEGQSIKSEDGGVMG